MHCTATPAQPAQEAAHRCLQSCKSAWHGSLFQHTPGSLSRSVPALRCRVLQKLPCQLLVQQPPQAASGGRAASRMLQRWEALQASDQHPCDGPGMEKGHKGGKSTTTCSQGGCSSWTRGRIGQAGGETQRRQEQRSLLSKRGVSAGDLQQMDSPDRGGQTCRGDGAAGPGGGW